LGLQPVTPLLNHINVTNQHYASLLGEVLGLTGRSHQLLFGIKDSHIACGGYNPSGVISLLQI
jgi:hypothetical protein